MIKKLMCLGLAVALVMCISPVITAKADAPLDEIEEYKITVYMESDGTMYITYHIEWCVLDSTSEGPLTWVKIGIPNEYAYDIEALSSSINNITYYSDAGDYVRIDLDKSYNAGETVTMDFSLRQPYMYTLDDDRCRFEYTPGWFEGIEVKSLVILWNNENVLDSNAPDTEGNYLKWTAALAPGERYCVSVNYGTDAFDTSSYPTYDPIYTPDSELPADYIDYTYDDYSYDSGDSGSDIGAIFMIIFGVIIVVVRIVIIINRLRGGGGGYGGGFGTRGGGHFGGGGHCACACACGCACACACAGGGRAGCSAKNFYSSAPRTDKLELILKRGSNNIR